MGSCGEVHGEVMITRGKITDGVWEAHVKLVLSDSSLKNVSTSLALLYYFCSHR